MTIVYTTHYMEEVEALCDRIAIIDRGEVIACGTLAELQARHAATGVSSSSRAMTPRSTRPRTLPV